MSWREVNEEMERMERIVGEMEDAETEGSAIEGVEGGDHDRQRDRDQDQEGDGQDHDDREEESEAAAVEHAEIEAQVHRGEVKEGVIE